MEYLVTKKFNNGKVFYYSYYTGDSAGYAVNSKDPNEIKKCQTFHELEKFLSTQDKIDKYIVPLYTDAKKTDPNAKDRIDDILLKLLVLYIKHFTKGTVLFDIKQLALNTSWQKPAFTLYELHDIVDGMYKKAKEKIELK